MEKTNPAIEKLQRIKELWTELGQKKLNSPEYNALTEKIRILSAEYQALAEATREPKMSK
jgi:hypothetical protein